MLPQSTPTSPRYSHTRHLVLIQLSAWLWLAAQPALLLLLGVVLQLLPRDRHTWSWDYISVFIEIQKVQTVKYKIGAD